MNREQHQRMIERYIDRLQWDNHHRFRHHIPFELFLDDEFFPRHHMRRFLRELNRHHRVQRQNRDRQRIEQVPIEGPPRNRGVRRPAPDPPAPPPPRRRYPIGSGFPVEMNATFNRKSRAPIIAEGAHGDLKWVVKWTTHILTEDTVVGRATMSFDGMGDKWYKIYTTYKSTAWMQHESKKPPADNAVLINKDRYEIVFPETLIASDENGLDGFPLVKPSTLNVTVHNIKVMDKTKLIQERWPGGEEWFRFPDVCTVCLDTKRLEAINDSFKTLYADWKQKTMSLKEAKALYDFACVYYQKAYFGQDKYHEIMLNGYKLGFTKGWDTLDRLESPLDFQTRTMLPTYQLLTDEETLKQTVTDGDTSGSIQIIKLDLNPNVYYKRSQTVLMNNIRGHKGNLSFFLEKTSHGILLIAAATLRPVSRQFAKMKIALFHDRDVTVRYHTYRIINKQQRTIKIIAAVLTDEQLQLLVEGRMKMSVQLHIHKSPYTYIHNYEVEEDMDTAYMMPGVVNGYLYCEDERLIGVCKEHVAHYSGWMEQLFYNQQFYDCGKSVIRIEAPSDVVLDALHIIYHRCHAVQVSQVESVLTLAEYWLAPVIIRYFDMAILDTTLIPIEEKVRLATMFNLDTTKYIMRHPQYHTKRNLELTDELRLQLNENIHSNELDGLEK